MGDSRMFELLNVGVEGEGKKILDDISAVFPSGAWTAVTGPSGAGKSTLLRLLALLRRPSAGKVLIEGRAPEPSTVVSLRRKAPLTLQEPVLVGDTVRENLLLPFSFESAAGTAGPDENQLAALLASVDLPGNMIDSSVRNLSGGEKQRVAIARALALSPAALLLDEPTSALDTVTAERVFDRIADSYPGLTLVVVTHSKPLLDRTTSQILLRGGCLRSVEHGLSDSLLRQFLEEN